MRRRPPPTPPGLPGRTSPASHALPSDSAGSFAAAAALASKSEAVRSPACGPEGCQWLQLTHNSEEQAREVRPGWSTFAYDMEE